MLVEKNPLIENPKAYGLGKPTTWRNNNSTVVVKDVYVIELKDLSDQVVKIITDIFNYNLNSKEKPFVVVFVAGWATKKPSLLSQIFSNTGKKERLLEEYAQSFSLSWIVSAVNANFILRAPKECQTMKLIQEEGKYYLRASAGVRITDGDQFLFEKGFAFHPNTPTLHPATLPGAQGTGAYGPAKNHSSFTTDIVRMKIINALGKKLNLSSIENRHLFEVLRDCHLGTCFVRNLTIEIEPKFLMKRCDILFKDIHELKEHMLKDNLVDKEHFVIMYIPVDIDNQEDHPPRIRITNFERTKEEPTEKIKTQKQKDFYDYLNLGITEVGEPIIDLITKCPLLRQFFPYFLKTAARKTFGTEKESSQIDWSASTMHIFKTYTDLSIYDINWLIQVEDAEDARDLLLHLLQLSEKLLVQEAKEHQYPLFNVFSRFLKGISYPQGKGGIAPTGVEKEGQCILSFEFVTYMPLAKTESFKTLRNAVIEYLKESKRKYHYHPGKHIPKKITSLKQIFTGPTDEKRLENFQNAVYELHGGKDNIPFSPLLTVQKKEFIFGSEVLEEKKEKTFTKKEDSIEFISDKEEKQPLTKDQKKLLKAIIKHAKKDKIENQDVIEKAKEHLEKK